MSPDPTSEGEQKCQYPQSVSQKPLNRNYFFIHTYTVSDGETVKDLPAPSDGNETEKKCMYNCHTLVSSPLLFQYVM